MENNILSLPSDFVARMQQMLGNEWDAFLQSFENEEHHGLRINSLKKGLTEEKIEAILGSFQIQPNDKIPWTQTGFYYDHSTRPGKHPFHEMGLYYIQEPSAMSAAEFLDVKPGHRVLDLCAAPGGKSTQLASKMEQQGLLVSNEIHPQRAKILSQNVERMGLSNVIVTNEDSNHLKDYFSEYFHRILVDAPCSGEGMFRKNPDATEEWSLANVELCKERQLMILDNAAKMLMNHGRMVYSTCTFAPLENEEVIYEFLATHPEFHIEKENAPYFDCGNPDWIQNEITDSCVDKSVVSDAFRLWPHHLKGEGHFVAVLQKGEKMETDTITLDTTSSYSKSKKKKPILDQEMQKNLEEFVKTNISQCLHSFLLEGELTLFGDQLYLLPNGSPRLSGIKVLRPGLHLGTYKKNRFEPSHALALFLGKEECNNTADISSTDSNVQAYYRGESIPVDAKNGWCLLCIDGLSAGWGKVNNGILKNHYPKGLRIQF